MDINSEHLTIGAIAAAIGAVGTFLVNVFRVGTQLGQLRAEVKSLSDKLDLLNAHAETTHTQLREDIKNAHERIDQFQARD
jgi:hypothetical protein